MWVTASLPRYRLHIILTASDKSAYQAFTSKIYFFKNSCCYEGMGWLNVQVADFIQNLHIAGSCIVKPTRLLFLLFINDLHLYIEQCDSDYYADDATVHTSGKTKSDVEAKLQHDRNKTKQWDKRNKMNRHYKKKHPV